MIFLACFILVSGISNFCFATSKCESKFLESYRQDITGNVNDLFHSLLSTDEFNLASQATGFENTFVIKLAETSEIRGISLWSDRQSNSYLIWSHRKGDEWMPLKNVNGERKIFRIKRKRDNADMFNFSTVMVADELLLLPLRRSVKSKYSTIESGLNWQIHGCPYDKGNCHYFDGSDRTRLIYDVKRHGTFAESKGELSFRMNTRSHSGVILSSYGNQGDFILVQLRNGRLMVIVNFGGNKPQAFSSSVSVNDGNWHVISLQYVYDDCKLYIDGVRIISTSTALSGYRLDLDRDIVIGGAQYVEPFIKYIVADNFTGFMEDLIWNGRTIELLTNDLVGCKKPTSPGGSILAFTDGKAWIQKRGRSWKTSSYKPAASPALRLSGRFRTVSASGHLWRTMEDNTKPWSDTLSTFNLSLIDGIFVCKIILDGDIFVLSSQRQVNDGIWHSFYIKLQNNLVELTVDNLPPIRLEAKFTVLTLLDQLYILGGDGFIGCIENLVVNEREEDLRYYERKWTSTASGDFGIIWDHCPLWNRCQPNPCANGGTCHQSSWNGFECICPYGYSGRVCSSVDLPHNCDEYLYFQRHRQHSESALIRIDLDDVGPLNALEVECRLAGSTVLHHDQLEPVEIRGFSDRGSAPINYKYGNMDSNNRMDSLTISALTKRSKQCRQEMSYKCFGGATLMQKYDSANNSVNEDQGPSSWWLSWMATHVYAWGDGQPGSFMCTCSVFGTCANERNCNCDSHNGEALNEDVGNATIKELLPIRRVFVGSTDYEKKYAVVKIGPMICNGDESSDAVTFLERRAYVEIPFQTAISDLSKLAGYLHFRTRECLVSLLSTIRRSDADENDNCEYLRLHVEDCRLVVLTICGGGGITKLSANFSQSINDDQWHSIRFTISARTMTLTLDNDDTISSIADHFYMLPDSSALSSWRLGATDEIGSGFTGAIRSLFLNGRWIPITDLDAFSVHGNVKGGLVNRCVSIDEYGQEDHDHWCFNGGKCEEHYYELKCSCDMTAFSGGRCQQDVSYDLVGALTFSNNFRSETLLGSDVDSDSITNVEYLRIGFQSKSVRSALLRGFDQRSKTDILALLLTDTGNLRLLYTDNYTPYTVEEDSRNFADGYFHDIEIKVDPDNRLIVMQVDHHWNRKLEWRYPSNVRPSLNRLDWIIGDDGLSTIFSGCISRLQIGKKFFPLKIAGAVVRAAGDTNGTQYRRSVCPAIDDNLPEINADVGPDVVEVPMEPFDTMSRWTDAPRIKMRPLKQSFDRSAFVGVIGAATACAVLSLFCCLIKFFRNRPAGVYKTHEETLYLSGPMSGHDSSRQALVTAAGDPSPSPVERREWFI